MFRGFLGIQQSTRQKTTWYHRSIYLSHSSENRIKIRSFLSYTSILHVSSLYVSALSQLTYYYFSSILNIPYKKGCWHAHSLPHSLSVEPADSKVPELQMEPVWQGGLWGLIFLGHMTVQFIMCTFVHSILDCWRLISICASWKPEMLLSKSNFLKLFDTILSLKENIRSVVWSCSSFTSIYISHFKTRKWK